MTKKITNIRKTTFPLRNIVLEYFYLQKAVRILPAETRLTVYRRPRVKLYHVELKVLSTDVRKCEKGSDVFSAVVFLCVRKMKNQKKIKNVDIFKFFWT